MLIEECRAMKLNIVPPNINRCDYKFTAAENNLQNIYYGLGAIKGAGEGAINGIVAERKENGHFSDLFDFGRRVDLRKVSRRLLEPLIKSGALDNLGANRAVIMASLDNAIKMAERYSSDTATGQNDIFGASQKSTEDKSPFVENVKPWNATEQLKGEKESLGLYLSGHPIKPYLPELAHFIHIPLDKIKPTEKKKTVRVAGWVIDLRIMTNQRGRMAFISLDDSTARLDVKVYSELYTTVHDMLVKNTLLVAEGEVRFDEYSGGYSMTAKNILTLDTARETYAKHLALRVSAQQASQDFAQKLVATLSPHRQGGRCPVLIHYQRADAEVELVLGESWRVKPNADLVMELRSLLGDDEVKVNY
jgi:DNA polymerase-3 subunit alpha